MGGQVTKPKIVTLEMLSPVVEFFKELGRIAVFAAIPIVIIQLESGKEIEWKSFVTALVIAILRAIDRAKHVELKNEGVVEGKGILPF